MSQSEPEDTHDGTTGLGVGDDQLPPDLVPGEDNPLAEGLEPGETAGDLFEDGRHAEQDSDQPSETESGDQDA